MKWSAIFIITMLVSLTSNATECRSTVSDFLFRSGHGNFDKPGVNKIPKNNGDIVFGDSFKDGFELIYSAKPEDKFPNITIHTRSALGTEETQRMWLDQDCNIQSIERGSAMGIMSVTADFCNKIEDHPEKISRTPSKEMLSGSNFDNCYSAERGYADICGRYRGKFSKTNVAERNTANSSATGRK